jgi:hypothetical protein
LYANDGVLLTNELHNKIAKWLEEVDEVEKYRSGDH